MFGGQAAAAVGVKQLDLGDVEDHLDFFAGVGAALRIQARDDMRGAARRARAGQLTQPGVLGQRRGSSDSAAWAWTSKYAYGSDPIDSTTSIVTLNFIPPV